MIETVDVFCTDFGVVAIGPDAKRLLASVKLTKRGQPDYRFKGARRVRDVLTAWERRKWIRDDELPRLP